jgi:alpha-1,2-mannosyltransferase
MLARLSAPEQPSRALWLALVIVVAALGLWRAARAARAGDEIAGLALTGLVAALVSPITWPHHVYWFVPALVVLVAAASAAGRGRRRFGLVALSIVGYAVAVFGVVSFVDFGVAAEPTDTPGEFLLRNAYVLVSLVLVAAMPVYTRSAVD